MFGLAVAIIIVQAVVIGFLVMRSRRPSYDGQVVVYDTPDKKTYSIEVAGDPEKLDEKKKIVLKVTIAS